MPTVGDVQPLPSSKGKYHRERCFRRQVPGPLQAGMHVLVAHRQKDHPQANLDMDPFHLLNPIREKCVSTLPNHQPYSRMSISSQVLAQMYIK
jgi:hypothetical protein